MSNEERGTHKSKIGSLSTYTLSFFPSYSLRITDYSFVCTSIFTILS